MKENRKSIVPLENSLAGALPNPLKQLLVHPGAQIRNQ